jgi:hypothetical protein
MLNNLHYFAFLLLFLIGCNSRKGHQEKFTLAYQNDSVNIHLDNTAKNFSIDFQYVEPSEVNDPLLVIQGSGKFEFYDLTLQKLIKTLPISSEGNNALPDVDGFVIGNSDTIFAISPFLNQIAVIDRDGKVIKRLRFGDDTGTISTRPAAYGFHRPVLLDDKIRINYNLVNVETSGILTSEQQKKSHLYIDVNLRTGQTVQSSLKYPEELIGKDISGADYRHTVGYNKSLVYCFGLTDSLHVSEDHKTFKKVIIETDYKLRLINNFWKYFVGDMDVRFNYLFNCDEFRDIIYDKYRECYYLVIRKRMKEAGRHVDYMINMLFPDCFIIILDKNLRPMGEVSFPNDTYSFQMMFVAPEGLYISEDHPNNPDFDEDFMRFRLFKLTKL